MNEIVKAFGGNFVAFLQPVRDLHKENTQATHQRTQFFGKVRHEIQSRKADLPVFDLLTIFDDITYNDPLSLFIDRVHLTDKGNAIFAEQIAEILRKKGLLVQ